MINLLSTNRKDELRAARVNVFLLRYIGIIVLAIIFIMSVLYVSQSVLMRSMSTANDRIEANQAKAASYSDTQEQVNALSARLGDAKSVLDQSVSYAKILTTLGQIMPPGTVLDSLVLNDAALSGTPTEITAYAKSEQDAVTINQNLQSSPIFSQVKLDGTDAAGGIANYPIKVTLTVVFNRSGL